jgi:glycyl-tRNA synthetase beta chain
MKRPLAEWNNPLQHRIFQEKLGTLADKIARMELISAAIQPYLGITNPKKAQEAIKLLKADLSTGMVGEFPELQGIMGSHYAIAQGIEPEIALAIREHYAPAGPQDLCPQKPLSIHVALVDKLDTLVGFFSVGLEPTASKDPYALRRTALGIIRLIYENELKVSLDDLLSATLRAYSFAPDQEKKIIEKVKEFVQDRLLIYLKPLYSASLLNAVIGKTWDGSITDLSQKLSALKAFLESPEGTDFIIVYKRVANILKRAEFPPDYLLKPELFTSEEEQLFTAIQETKSALETLLTDGPAFNYAKAIQVLGRLKSPLEVFFANVMVQDSNLDLRYNRLSLLKYIESECAKICDLDKL